MSPIITFYSFNFPYSHFPTLLVGYDVQARFQPSQSCLHIDLNLSRLSFCEVYKCLIILLYCMPKTKGEKKECINNKKYPVALTILMYIFVREIILSRSVWQQNLLFHCTSEETEAQRGEVRKLAQSPSLHVVSQRLQPAAGATALALKGFAMVSAAPATAKKERKPEGWDQSGEKLRPWF